MADIDDQTVIFLFGQVVMVDVPIPDPWADSDEAPCGEVSPEGLFCTSDDPVPHRLHVATGGSVAAIWAQPGSGGRVMTSPEWVFIAVTASTTLINAWMAFGVHDRFKRLEKVLTDRGVL